MRRIYILSFPFFSLLFSCAGEQAAPSAEQRAEAALWAQYKAEGWKNHGCELVTDAEIEQLFSFNGKEATLNARSLPGQCFCLRTWNKPDWHERESNNEKEGAAWLNPQNRLVIQLFDYHSVEHAKQQIGNLRRDRRNTYEEDVPGFAEDALWSTSTVTLLAQKGQFVVYVTLELSDNPHDNLPKAREVAALALMKL